MDLTQLLTIASAVLGIIVVGLLAVVPTMIELPARSVHHSAHRPRGHHRATGPRRMHMAH
ncbi:MAG TPA: hypothetical protein VFP89_13205 [Propionibacteriaceae bacterium]|nr:hypothetical protein [Propionibacteriaceae bacterium]